MNDSLPASCYTCVLLMCRLPVMEAIDEHDEPSMGHHSHQVTAGNAGPVVSRYPRWFNFAHVEARQCDLAATMLYASRGQWKKSETNVVLSSLPVITYVVLASLNLCLYYCNLCYSIVFSCSTY